MKDYRYKSVFQLLILVANVVWAVRSFSSVTKILNPSSGVSKHRNYDNFALTKSLFQKKEENQRNIRRGRQQSTTVVCSSVSATNIGPRVEINDSFPNLNRIHSNPDVFVISDFLSVDACQDLMQKATDKGDMKTSPVAYAGWTRDFVDLMELATKGPVSWAALIGAWYQVTHNTDTPENYNANIDLVIHAIQNFGILLVVAASIVSAFTYWRASSLQSMRTSTSTTLDDMEGGPKEFVERSSQLLQPSSSSETSIAASFEAPTIIRYEQGQVLKPHYDANSSASIEDANRGGQTLVTLLVYLNDVAQGGKTKFGKLNLEVSPKQGDALLFFPADKYGTPDDRTEHEGCAAIDEKWIARIWQHENRVPPPFGLRDDELKKLDQN